MIVLDIIIFTLFLITISYMCLMHIRIFWKSVNMFKATNKLNVFESMKNPEDVQDFIQSVQEVMKKKKKDNQEDEESDKKYSRGMYR